MPLSTLALQTWYVVQAILVGPECGAWKLTEVVVSNSRLALTQNFVCRQHLGTKWGKGAALIPAVPPGAVVYGSGDTAILLSAVRSVFETIHIVSCPAIAMCIHSCVFWHHTAPCLSPSFLYFFSLFAQHICLQRDAERMRKASMQQYGDLKQRIFNFTSILVTTGLFVAAFTGGAEAAEAFALGGMMAFIYQVALNGSVDNLALEQPQPAVDLGLRGAGKGPTGAVRAAPAPAKNGFGMQMLSGGLKRYALVTAMLLGAIVATQLWDGAPL